VNRGLRLVGFEELSAGAVRARLLARAGEFWAGSTLGLHDAVALHDPVFFHQLGGFGAVDRLAVVHALAVHPGHRRTGLAVALLRRFAGLATGTGARAAQAVVLPDDTAALGLAARLGAHVAPSPGHAGPGADRLVLTRRLPLD
jgi:GNAT superfamily N-acetyltransferase